MDLAGNLVIENFNYGVSDAELPLFIGNDEPLIDEETGEQQTAKLKILYIEATPSTQIEIRVAEGEWDNFLAKLAEKPVVETADLEDLARLSG